MSAVNQTSTFHSKCIGHADLTSVCSAYALGPHALVAIRLGLCLGSCHEAQVKHHLNLTRFQALSWAYFRTGRRGRGQLQAASARHLLTLAQEVWQVKSELLPKACPAAVAVAAGILMGGEVHVSNSVRTNFDHEEHFNRLAVYERTMVEAAHECGHDVRWPLIFAYDVLRKVGDWLVHRVEKSQKLWDPDNIEEKEITDEQHIQALEDIAAVLDSEGLEWWPCRGTLIALLRHGRRSGKLAGDRIDVVDHDVDVMVGLPSEDHWLTLKWSISEKLRARGWGECYGRYSVDASQESQELLLAREDLMLCVRHNPHMVLDIATYIMAERSVYAQRYCPPSRRLLGEPLKRQLSACWVPRNRGTLKANFGRLARRAILPLGRCRAGHLAVPCPRRPLETLKATMPGVNFSQHCLAFPDVARRRARGYASDQQWLAEELSEEDVEILRRRAKELDDAGFMSMTPYFPSCNA
ncbi:unnamed protein product [Effrenium voratum]|nr:unnamed protein product [Effrenium voratum]